MFLIFLFTRFVSRAVHLYEKGFEIRSLLSKTPPRLKIPNSKKAENTQQVDRVNLHSAAAGAQREGCSHPRKQRHPKEDQGEPQLGQARGPVFFPHFGGPGTAGGPGKAPRAEGRRPCARQFPGHTRWSRSPSDSRDSLPALLLSSSVLDLFDGRK